MIKNRHREKRVIIIARARPISRGATRASRGTREHGGRGRGTIKKDLNDLSRLSHSPLFSFTAHVGVNITAGIRGRKSEKTGRSDEAVRGGRDVIACGFLASEREREREIAVFVATRRAGERC